MVGAKFKRNMSGHLDAAAEKRLLALFGDRDAFAAMAVDEFMDLLSLKA